MTIKKIVVVDIFLRFRRRPHASYTKGKTFFGDVIPKKEVKHSHYLKLSGRIFFRYMGHTSTVAHIFTFFFFQPFPLSFTVIIDFKSRFIPLLRLLLIIFYFIFLSLFSLDPLYFCHICVCFLVLCSLLFVILALVVSEQGLNAESLVVLFQQDFVGPALYLLNFFSTMPLFQLKELNLIYCLETQFITLTIDLFPHDP